MFYYNNIFLNNIPKKAAVELNVIKLSDCLIIWIIGLSINLKFLQRIKFKIFVNFFQMDEIF